MNFILDCLQVANINQIDVNYLSQIIIIVIEHVKCFTDLIIHALFYNTYIIYMSIKELLSNTYIIYILGLGAITLQVFAGTEGAHKLLGTIHKIITTGGGLATTSQMRYGGNNNNDKDKDKDKKDQDKKPDTLADGINDSNNNTKDTTKSFALAFILSFFNIDIYNTNFVSEIVQLKTTYFVLSLVSLLCFFNVFIYS